MCVIVHQPEGAYLDKDTASRLWKVNDHGGGYAFIEPTSQQIEIKKSMDFEEFWSNFERDRSQHRDADFLLHMRIATHGSIDLDNVHPFVVNEHTVMAHNGIIHDVPNDKELSDTRVFIRDVLPELPEDWLDRRYIVQMVEEWIGWSKLMFLTNDPRLERSVYILNERKGKKHKGMWFSNDNGLYKPYKASFTGPRKKELPKGSTFPTTVAESSEGWEEFLAASDPKPKKKVSRVGSRKKRARVVGPPVERNRLENYRKTEHSVYSPLSWRGSTKGWDCLGCDEPVPSVRNSEKYGECDCWNTVCLDCDDFAAICECPLGYSGNTAHWMQLSDQELMDIFDMTEGEVEEVNKQLNRPTTLGFLSKEDEAIVSSWAWD